MREINFATRMVRAAAPALALGLALAGLGACNTISGAGKDVSAAGTAVTGASGATQQKLPDTPKP